MLDRRQDHKTADQIADAARMKRAFGWDAGVKFLQLRGVGEDLAREALAGRYERRRDPLVRLSN